MDAARFIYMTAPDEESADRIAEALVSERLAACVNILPGMKSVYRWQGHVRRGTEVVVIAKTSARRAHDLRNRVLALHPDETPCVVALPIETAASAPEFLAWIMDETA